MIFLTNDNNKRVMIVEDKDTAIEIYKEAMNKGVILGVYGAENLSKFKLLHPKYKDYKYTKWGESRPLETEWDSEWIHNSF